MLVSGFSNALRSSLKRHTKMQDAQTAVWWSELVSTRPVILTLICWCGTYVWAVRVLTILDYRHWTTCNLFYICLTGPEMLWSLPPWSYPKAILTRSWATRSRWPCLIRWDWSRGPPEVPLHLNPAVIPWITMHLKNN